MSLRRWQLEAARKGNASLLIWLGKQMLGQKDTIEIDGDSGIKLTMNYERKKKA